MNPRRLVPAVLLALFLGAAVVSAMYFWEAHAEYARHREREAAGRARLAAKEAQMHEQERILNRLRTDPAFVEKIIRQKLGYVRPGDVIFRFEN